ncbi:S8 family peptidase [Paraburkholderia caribensis]|uniref:S8 family peptidase n=1 Tax=Paraburkholderia caribensis TaxID=75105 RepID=UPI000A459E39|nr:S8 family serine peptidase [Paraburkholderia caribensis]
MPKIRRTRAIRKRRFNLLADSANAAHTPERSRRVKDIRMVVAVDFEQDSSFLFELKRRAAGDPAQGNLGVIAGAEDHGCQCGKPRLYYADRPDEGASAASIQAFSELLAAGSVQAVAADGSTTEVPVVDTILGEGLVIKATVEEQKQIQLKHSGLLLLPSASLYPQMVQITSLNAGAPLNVPANTGKRIVVNVRADGVPLPGIKVRGYLSQANFVEDVTDEKGFCELRVPKAHSAKVAVSAIPIHTYWSYTKEIELARAIGAVADFDLERLTPTWLEAFTHRIDDMDPAAAGLGVRVGVIDTGVSKDHSLLHVADGGSYVIGEFDNLDWDDTEGHGTMVAGLIAAQGDGKSTPRGLAPACELHAYRICARGSIRAEETALASAIRAATDNGCDLLNISFGGTIQMSTVQRAMRDAAAKGVVCIVAAGNGFRRHVSFPGCYPQAVSVSAMGRLNAYPRTSEFVFSETRDTGHDERDYVSTFTNIGDQLHLCAPGVGIVSCWPENRLAAGRGTSFAAPIATGLLARILSTSAGRDILRSERNSNRADQIRDLALNSAKVFGFQPTHEGYGLPGSK